MRVKRKDGRFEFFVPTAIELTDGKFLGLVAHGIEGEPAKTVQYYQAEIHESAAEALEGALLVAQNMRGPLTEFNR